SGSPRHSGGQNSRTSRHLVKQAAWLWLGGVIVISVILFARMSYYASNHSAEGTVTVGEAIAGTQSAADAGWGATEEEHSQRYPGYRLVELAAALGLPNGAAPEGALEMGMSHDQARIYLMELVNQGVTKGVLTP